MFINFKKSNSDSGSLGNQSIGEQRPEFSGCSLSVEQPECQKKDSQVLTFKWENCGNPKNAIIEIDDDIDFSHVEFTSEMLNVSGSEQVVRPTGLISGKSYHPSINLIQEDGFWLGWRDNGTKSFVFAAACNE